MKLSEEIPGRTGGRAFKIQYLRRWGRWGVTSVSQVGEQEEARVCSDDGRCEPVGSDRNSRTIRPVGMNRGSFTGQSRNLEGVGCQDRV